MGKSKQKISNWKLYNLALVKRGSLTLWMDEQAIKHWHCQTHHGRRGRGFHYSDRAIDTALVLKIRANQWVINKSLYLALGINMEGHKELLGLWLAETEGAKFWLSVLTELKDRGLEDILLACVDGLKGFPDAIAVEYPQTKVQLCIVHMVRNSLRYVSWKDCKAVTAELKQIYQSATEREGQQALATFGERWDSQYPQIARSWHNNWDNLITLFDYPPAIRKVIYTTNALESLNSVLRKATKQRKLFPTDESALKVAFLAIQQASKKWTMPIQNWKPALNRFIIEFGDRLNGHL
ncbi:IS256 family transposase [Aeromonas salmonicida]|uniref:IS256 family transposase n=1 Tax=Aeromonas salmonicida TaxID=645 RepID=UPI001F58CA4F|nr:IS256 family transposase [Aeromonas salmonicida]